MLDYKIPANIKGSAFIIVMIILLVVSLLGMSIISMTVNNFSMNTTEQNYMAAFYIAEAGLRHQLEHIRLKMEELYASDSYLDASGFFHALELAMPCQPPTFENHYGTVPDIEINVSSQGYDGNTATYAITSTGRIDKISRTMSAKIEISWMDAGQSGGMDDDHPLLKDRAAILTNGNIYFNKHKDGSSGKYRVDLLNSGRIFCDSVNNQYVLNALDICEVEDGHLSSGQLNDYVNGFRDYSGFDNYLKLNDFTVTESGKRYEIKGESGNNQIFGSPLDPVVFVTPKGNTTPVWIHSKVWKIYGILCIDGDLEFSGSTTEIHGAVIVNGDILTNDNGNGLYKIIYNENIVRRALQKPGYENFFQYTGGGIRSPIDELFKTISWSEL